MRYIVRYVSNNSGGVWWLTTQDWERLEEQGWTVHWENRRDHLNGYSHNFDLNTYPTLFPRTGDTFLRAEARSAAIETDDPMDAVTGWTAATGEYPYSEGCACCGRPHDFTIYDREIGAVVGFDDVYGL